MVVAISPRNRGREHVGGDEHSPHVTGKLPCAEGATLRYRLLPFRDGGQPRTWPLSQGASEWLTLAMARSDLATMKVSSERAGEFLCSALHPQAVYTLPDLSA
jgi:hypothetical protein